MYTVRVQLTEVLRAPRRGQAGSRAVSSEDGTYRINHGELLSKQTEVKGDIRDIYI